MGRILGVDYGDSRVGLALSDPTKMIASPFKTIDNKSHNYLIDYFIIIIKKKDIESFVLGLPISLKGKDTIQTIKVREFGKFLEQLGKPVIFQDERLSTISAKYSLKLENIKTGHNKHRVDKRAAAIILQQYLDISRK
tara:strand:- start:77 stop:490 length:414 start_codon:yes stop_codon:yes gene_type:complete